jgi:CTP synthase (UTP-ammonia lyase)
MDTIEMFACNYGLNAAFEDHMRSKDLIVSGSDEDGTSRMVELPGHPFFIATLFVPQVLSQQERPHPLVRAFVEAASSLG